MSRGIFRALRQTQSLLLLAAIASVGWMAMRLTAYEERIDELRAAQEKQRAPPARSVTYVVGMAPPPAQTVEAAPDEAVPPPEWDDGALEEAETPPEPRTLEERVAAQVARYEHLTDVFEQQDAADYDVARTRFFTATLSERLDDVELPDAVRLGDVECRGRMCALAVEFPDPGQIAPLKRVTQAVVADAISEGHDPPRVHFMTRPAQDGSEREGRFFFEWRS